MLKQAFAALALVCAAPAIAEPQRVSAVVLPEGVDVKPVEWFSEQVGVSGRLFTPAGFSETSSAPAVVLARLTGARRPKASAPMRRRLRAPGRWRWRSTIAAGASRAG